jgi:heme/copper-type cytochrome/quinol oxidase subunit 2
MRIFLALLITGLLLTACKEKTVPQQPVEEAPVIIDVTKEENPTPQTIELPVTLTKQFFNPNTVAVRKGDTVTLHITSVDVDHNVAVPQYSVSKPVLKGQTETVTFVVDRTGTIEVQCDDRCNPNVVFAVTAS